MNKGLKYLLYLLALMLVIVPTIFAFILFNSSKHAFDDSFSHTDERQSKLRDSKVNAAKEPVSILFLGIDDSSSRRENGQSTEHSRTDAMILSTLNPDKHQIRLLSIPRDTLSYIPKVGYFDKITHAHAYGGPESSMDAVETELNVPVDYYVRINMDAFADTVDELGGIEYNVPYNLNEPNTKDKGRIKLKKGKQKLNGDEALAITRTRKQDSDLKRGERQMEVLKILFRKAQETNSLHKLDDIIEIVGKNSKHNLNYSEIRALATNYLANDVTIKSQQLKGENELLNGIYYINPDVDDLIKTSNLLREDLELRPIKNKSDFLLQRAKSFYGEIPPLTEIDDQLLKGHQKSQKDNTSSEQQNGDSQASPANDQNQPAVTEQTPSQQPALPQQSQGVPDPSQNNNTFY
ncbi:LCP family protein [Staphylococcus coagulans]|uniref:LCP family protein n=1 Tax=Staphylococcus coagulans TaxID=74706 RepID=UPI001BE57336|nr:LCP family protein [Staphylococcus coagulans]MBT2813519.1 LCP family protein [Staphylococcus coagulans]MBT2815782.1 LCP family protein [Staphylococcus coagulans]MBT2836829.1 LCP family protein [Staphylococcus coagulans]MBT2841357.1 LCP family protein [Staphylococcus coagulans]MBT2847744.1 LCP family protein [Staphylococcus coagulans]